MTETLKRTLCTLSFEESLGRDGLKDWRIGEAFAFNEDAEQSIVFLGRPGGAVLDSKESTVTVSSAPINLPRLEAVFTDRDLYREGVDIVRIVACCPREADQRVTIVLDMNGQELARPEVELDSTGMGLFELPEPVAGEYEVRFGASKSTFTVAAYKLAPLTARFEGYELRDNEGRQTLAFSAHLETYGSAFSGDIVVIVARCASSDMGACGWWLAVEPMTSPSCPS